MQDETNSGDPNNSTTLGCCFFSKQATKHSSCDKARHRSAHDCNNYWEAYLMEVHTVVCRNQCSSLAMIVTEKMWLRLLCLLSLIWCIRDAEAKLEAQLNNSVQNTVQNSYWFLWSQRKSLPSGEMWKYSSQVQLETISRGTITDTWWRAWPASWHWSPWWGARCWRTVSWWVLDGDGHWWSCWYCLSHWLPWWLVKCWRTASWWVKSIFPKCLLSSVNGSYKSKR